MEFLNDDLDVLDIVENGFPRRRYERDEYFDTMDELTFFKRFRLLKPTVEAVLLEIEEELEAEERNNYVSPMNQLLTMLRFYATGSHLSTIGDFMGIHEGTASKIVKRTSEAVARLRPTKANMPQTEAEIIEVQNDFFGIASFPRVLGDIDGTHVRIQSPGGDDGEIYRNRKLFFSINVQLIGDSKLKIRDIVARWPGSQHDNTIFEHSHIKARFEAGEFRNSVLLGDSAYSLQNYLLTPIANPVGRGQLLYNEAHIRTRNAVERLNGVLKRRFPVLAYGIRLKLETALTVIVAAGVLHNIARDMNEVEPPIEENMNERELNYLIEMGNIPDQPLPVYNAGQNYIYRNEIIDYFNNLPV